MTPQGAEELLLAVQALFGVWWSCVGVPDGKPLAALSEDGLQISTPKTYRHKQITNASVRNANQT